MEWIREHKEECLAIASAMIDAATELYSSLRGDYSSLRNEILSTISQISLFKPNVQLAMRLKQTVEGIRDRAKEILSPLFARIQCLITKATNFAPVVAGIVASFQIGLNFDIKNGDFEDFVEQIIGNIINVTTICCISAGAVTVGSVALGAALGAATFGVGMIVGSLVGDSKFKRDLNGSLDQVNKKISQLDIFRAEVLASLSKITLSLN